MRFPLAHAFSDSIEPYCDLFAQNIVILFLCSLTGLTIYPSWHHPRISSSRKGIEEISWPVHQHSIMSADLLMSDTPIGSSLNNLTPLSELVRLSSKRTRAVFQTESGDADFGGVDRA
jgi:hypothetical protein